MGGRLDGKIAIVTDGGQGIGRGIALALACEGAAVTVTGCTLAKPAEVVKEIAAAGGRALAASGDAGSRGDTARWLDGAVAKEGDPRPHQGRGPRVGRYRRRPGHRRRHDRRDPRRLLVWRLGPLRACNGTAPARGALRQPRHLPAAAAREPAPQPRHPPCAIMVPPTTTRSTSAATFTLFISPCLTD
jgi:NAD(P)-dependent dehydrogenase (short-subunit alcohol dehydrogenase family)